MKKIHECMEREGKVASHLNKTKQNISLIPGLYCHQYWVKKGQKGSNTESTEGLASYSGSWKDEGNEASKGLGMGANRTCHVCIIGATNLPSVLGHGDNFSAGVDPCVCSRESTGVVHLVRDILVGVS